MSTEKTICDWISRYIKFHQFKRHPSMGITKNEVKKVLGNISGTQLLMVKLLHGCGFWLMECVRMRI